MVQIQILPQARISTVLKEAGSTLQDVNTGWMTDRMMLASIHFGLRAGHQ